MMRRHVIDKFGHSLYLGERRSHSGDDYDIGEDGTKILRVANDPDSDRSLAASLSALKTEVETLRGETSLQGIAVTGYQTSIEELKSELKSLKEQLPELRQTLTYDEGKKIFKCAGKEFDLVVNDPDNPVLVTARNALSGMAMYRGGEYRHITHVFNVGMRLLTSNGSKFVWNGGEKVIKPYLDGEQNQNLARFKPVPYL